MTPTNRLIASKLRERAAELARSRANLYRVRALRQAAMAVLALPADLTELLAAGGEPALERIPGIGKNLARVIATYLQTASLAA